MTTESMEGEWSETPEEGFGAPSGNSEMADEVLQELLGMTRGWAKKVLAHLGKGNRN